LSIIALINASIKVLLLYVQNYECFFFLKYFNIIVYLKVIPEAKASSIDIIFKSKEIMAV